MRTTAHGTSKLFGPRGPPGSRSFPSMQNFIRMKSRMFLPTAGRGSALSPHDRLQDVSASAAGGRVTVANIEADFTNWRPASNSVSHADAAASLAWLFYTSGTTGKPKGVMLTHENLLQMVLNFRTNVTQVGRDDCLLHVAPPSHGSGMYMLAYLEAGAPNVVARKYRFETADLDLLLRHHRNVSFFCAPTMVRALLDQSDLNVLSVDNIRMIIYGGGPMYVVDILEAYRRFGAKFAQIYGQGECPMTITTLSRLDIDRAARCGDLDTLGSVGYPFTGVEVRIVESEGTDWIHWSVQPSVESSAP